MINLIDKELLELAAQAVGIKGTYQHRESHERVSCSLKGIMHQQYEYHECVNCGIAPDRSSESEWWNPLRSVEDRYELAKTLGLTIDFNNSEVFKMMPDKTLIQEFWSKEHPYVLEEYAIVQVAADIAVYMKTNKLDFNI